MPLGNALLCIRVEVLLLLIEESLRLYGIGLLLLEFLDALSLLGIVLSLDEGSQLLCSLSFFLFLLLFGQLQLLVTDPPEFSKIFVFLFFSGRLLLFTLNLDCSATLNSIFHVGFPLLLLIIESVSFVFSLSNLSVQYLILVVLKLLQLFDLTVNHALSLILLGFESFILTFFFHLITLVSLLRELADFLFFFYFLE